jgi:hypothetical protein
MSAPPSLSCAIRASQAALGAAFALTLGSAVAFAAEAQAPPEILELEPVTVEEKRFEEEVERIERESEAIQERMERARRPEQTQIIETHDNAGTTRAKIQTRWSTYCLEAPSTSFYRNEHGPNVALPTNCANK